MQKAKSLTEAKITLSGLHACLLRMSCYNGQQYKKLAWKVQEPEQDDCMRHLMVEAKLFVEKNEITRGLVEKQRYDHD